MKVEAKDYIIMFGIFIGGLSATGYSIYQYYDGVQKDEENKDLNNRLLSSQDSIITEQRDAKIAAEKLAEANRKNFELSQELNNKANNIIESNQKVIDAQGETIKKVMGDGYITVSSFVVSNSHDRKFIFSNDSDYPIYDASIKVYDFDKVRNCRYNYDENERLSIDAICFNQSIITEFTDKCSVSNTNTYSIETFNNTQTKHIFIKIHSRNSSIAYQCVFFAMSDRMSFKRFIMRSGKIESIEYGGDSTLPEEYWKYHFLSGPDFDVTNVYPSN